MSFLRGTYSLETEQERNKRYIFCPYKYKELIKKNGGLYDPDKLQWYILKSNPKYQQIVDVFHDENFNIYQGEYFIKPKPYIMTEHKRIHGF